MCLFVVLYFSGISFTLCGDRRVSMFCCHYSCIGIANSRTVVWAKWVSAMWYGNEEPWNKIFGMNQNNSSEFYNLTTIYLNEPECCPFCPVACWFICISHLMRQDVDAVHCVVFSNLYLFCSFAISTKTNFWWTKTKCTPNLRRWSVFFSGVYVCFIERHNTISNVFKCKLNLNANSQCSFYDLLFVSVYLYILPTSKFSINRKIRQIDSLRSDITEFIKNLNSCILTLNDFFHL